MGRFPLAVSLPCWDNSECRLKWLLAKKYTVFSIRKVVMRLRHSLQCYRRRKSNTILKQDSCACLDNFNIFTLVIPAANACIWVQIKSIERWWLYPTIPVLWQRTHSNEFLLTLFTLVASWHQSLGNKHIGGETPLKWELLRLRRSYHSLDSL